MIYQLALPVLFSVFKPTHEFAVPSRHHSLPVEFIMCESSLSFERGSFILSVSVLLIVQPLSFVVLKFTIELTIARSLPIDHSPNIFGTVRIGDLDLSINLTIRERSLNPRAVGKFEYTWSLPHIIFVAALILEVMIAEVIGSLAVPFLRLEV